MRGLNVTTPAKSRVYVPELFISRSYFAPLVGTTRDAAADSAMVTWPPAALVTVQVNAVATVPPGIWRIWAVKVRPATFMGVEVSVVKNRVRDQSVPCSIVISYEAAMA